jgi:hypothetical protein
MSMRFLNVHREFRAKMRGNMAKKSSKPVIFEQFYQMFSLHKALQQFVQQEIDLQKATCI